MDDARVLATAPEDTARSILGFIVQSGGAQDYSAVRRNHQLSGAAPKDFVPGLRCALERRWIEFDGSGILLSVTDEGRRQQRHFSGAGDLDRRAAS